MDLPSRTEIVDGPAVGGPFGDSAWAIVGGCGNVESLGKYIAMGRLDRAGDGSRTLTIARRFLSADDSRATMTCADLIDRIDEGGVDESFSFDPWHTLMPKVVRGTEWGETFSSMDAPTSKRRKQAVDREWKALGLPPESGSGSEGEGTGEGDW